MTVSEGFSVPQPHYSGWFSPTIFDEIEKLRRSEDFAERQPELQRLRSLANRMRELEKLGQRILAAVRSDISSKDPLEIPEFLRRY